MGIKFEANFLLVAWAIVPCVMFATKIFRMDAKDRHSLDMRMKHHSSFWIKGNMLVDGVERVVLSQAAAEDVFRGITVDDAENAAINQKQQQLRASKTGLAAMKDEKAIQQITSKSTTGSKSNNFALRYFSGALPEDAEVVSSSISGMRGEKEAKAMAAASQLDVPFDHSVALIPERVWLAAEANFRNTAENRRNYPLRFFE